MKQVDLTSRQYVRQNETDNQPQEEQPNKPMNNLLKLRDKQLKKEPKAIEEKIDRKKLMLLLQFYLIEFKTHQSQICRESNYRARNEVITKDFFYSCVTP